jgi:hypothetical protein
MMTKWILTAALFCGITASVPASAAPTEPLAAAPVRIEIRGLLTVIGPVNTRPNDIDPHFHICFPPLREYVIEANGQRFNLNMGRFQGKADGLNGNLVIVTGTLDLDTVTVTSLEEPRDESLRQYIRVTIEGQLQREEIQACDPRGQTFAMWRVYSGKVSYTLSFANNKVEAVARTLAGKNVVLTGSFKDAIVQVDDVNEPIEDIDPWFNLPLPGPVPFPGVVR